MAKNDPRELAGARLRQLREQLGISTADMAKRVDRSESAVRNQENGTNGIPTKLAQKYASILGTTASYILYGDDAPIARRAPEPGMLPVRRRVQAGAFLRVDQVNQATPKKIPAAIDPRFGHAPQWLSEVVGDSMNALGDPYGPIREGDYVHCVDAIEIGYSPQTGHVVEVERLRFGGAEVEVTIKQAERVGNEVLLWPRSTNPAHREPVRLGQGVADGEEYEVRISGLVLGIVRRFQM